MSDLLRYSDSVIEFEAAMDAGRASFVTPRWLRELADGMDPVQRAIVDSCGSVAVRSLRKSPAKRKETAAELMERFAETLEEKDMEIVRGVWDYCQRRAKFVAEREPSQEGGDGALRYAGTWRNDMAYTRGAMVTDGGQLWYARSTEPKGRPGKEGSAGWQLMAK